MRLNYIVCALDALLISIAGYMAMHGMEGCGWFLFFTLFTGPLTLEARGK